MVNSLKTNFIAYAFLNIFNLAFPFFVVPIVYHRLGVSVIGELTFVQNIVGYFILLGNLAIPNYGIREIAKNKDNKSQLTKIFSELLILQVILNLVCLLVYLITIKYFISSSKIAVTPALYYISAISIFSGGLALTWVFEGLEEFKFITLRTVSFKALSGVLIFFFVQTSNDLIVYSICLVMPDLILGIISSWVLIKRIQPKLINPTNAFQQHIKNLLNVFMMYSAYFIIANFDVSFLGYSTNNHEVAYYGICSKIISILYTLLLSFIYVAGPRLASHLKNNPVSYKELLFKLSNIFILPVCFIVAILIIFRFKILYFFGGNQFLTAGNTLLIFGIYFFIMSFRYFISSYLYFQHGKEKFVAYMFYIFITLGIIIKFIYINHMSANFAIIITTISELMILIVLYFNINKLIKLKFNLFTLNNTKCIISTILTIFIISKLLTLFESTNYLLQLSFGIILSGMVFLICLVFLKEDNIRIILKKLNGISLKLISK